MGGEGDKVDRKEGGVGDVFLAIFYRHVASPGISKSAAIPTYPGLYSLPWSPFVSITFCYALVDNLLLVPPTVGLTDGLD